MASSSEFDDYRVDQILTLVVLPGPESEAKETTPQAADETKKEAAKEETNESKGRRETTETRKTQAMEEKQETQNTKDTDEMAETIVKGIYKDPVTTLSRGEPPVSPSSPSPAPSPFLSTIQVRIRKLVEPRSLSCCMVVDVVSPNLPGGLPSTLFLKLYDRRFADQLRSDFGAEPWSEESKAAYHEAVESGAAAKFLHDLETIDDFRHDTEEDWNSWQLEAFLGTKADEMYEAETRAYDRLADMQGKQLPRLVARVELALPSDGITSLPPVKGILLQYIDGFPLREVYKNAPRLAWQGIVDQAVAAVRTANDYEIINRDVRLSNFLVEKAGDEDKTDVQYRAYMFDFGLSHVRTTETDREWATEKIEMDEDGAVGLMMKKILAQDADGFELQYEDSERYWADAGVRNGGDDDDE